ncbi:hypothetical protein Egran_04094 [Elaphomyces granulatus]|uniref:Uncharacterized protein n=1 Tax=Elaphomyces granulatus TaxID=519963 RepID=A0A232LVK4_9EURO|nr:hypothetical protein Egran_04094 [Elaphomyces granulatus]
MAMQYVNGLVSRASVRRVKKAQGPILDGEDEAFLQRVVSQSSEGESPPLPDRSLNAQIALMDGAQNIPLPLSPSEDSEKVLGVNQKISENGRGKDENTETDSQGAASKKKNRDMIAASPSQVVTSHKGPDGKPIGAYEEQGEEQGVAEILEQLNLAAVNNRAFSISDETRQLLLKFKLVFKDLINGVPTAYHDLESLLTNSDNQLQHAFNHLPGFLQKLIKQLFEKLPAILIPEGLAAADVKASASGVNMENAGKMAAAAAAAKKMGFKAPSLQELVGKPSALVTMLRTIIGFLRARFPAVMGMNILWSLALFILLMALWYCHKRGSEVRLEKERLALEAEFAKANESSTAQVGAIDPLSTVVSKDRSNDEESPQTSREEEEAKEVATRDGEYISPHHYSASPSPLSKYRAQFNKSEPSSKSTMDIQPYPGT